MLNFFAAPMGPDYKRYERGGKYTKPAVVMEDGGTISKISLSEAAKGDREL